MQDLFVKCKYTVELINPRCMRNRGNYSTWFVCLSVTMLAAMYMSKFLSCCFKIFTIELSLKMLYSTVLVSFADHLLPSSLLN